MRIEQLHSLTDRQVEDIQALMCELAPDIPVSAEMLQRAVETGNTHFFAMVAEDGRIIGCATLCVYNSPTGRKASVEDVVVGAAYRGQHLGRQLMEHMIDYAKRELSSIDLHLTSNSKRVSAECAIQSYRV